MVTLAAPPPRLRFSAWAPFPIAVLVAVAAGVAIASPAIYARETASWAAQGTGQDWINLLVCAPALLAAGARALGGSRRARIVVGGLLVYTAYSFVIYAFAMHFTPLFLVYCGLLGGSAFALGDLVAALRPDDPGAWYRPHAPIRTAGGTLIGVAVIFGALWLREIVPALVAGRDPPGLAEVGLVANPVHILDLSLVLPALAAAGIALLRHRPAGMLFAPILLTFGVVMAIAIGGMVAMMRIRGVALDATPAAAMAIVAVWCLGVLIALLRQMRGRDAG